MLRYIPNLLTVMRLCLVPVFVYAFFLESPKRFTAALIVFVISGITDLLDGYLARTFNWITAVGTALDPLADKLMMMTVLGCLVFEHLVPAFVLVIILINEFSMILMALYIYLSKSKTVVPANRSGKFATALLFFALVLVLLGVYEPVSLGVMIFAVGMKLVALMGYAKHYLTTIRHL